MIFCKAGESGTSDWANTAGTATKAVAIRDRSILNT